MSTSLITIGTAYIARIEGQTGALFWQPIWPDDRTGGWCSHACDEAGGGGVTRLDPMAVAKDPRAAAYGTRQRALVALGEHGVDVPVGAPRRDPTAARVVKSYRVHPTTAAKIEAAARLSGESQGQIIDRMAQKLNA